jgi:hypothetical protein
MTILTPYPTNAPTLPLIPNPTSLLVSIFSSTGLCRILEEKHFDACTALSGSGPAFACIVLEAMADGGVMMGLPRKEALELAAQTMQGAARMVLTGLHPAQLKDSVTSELSPPFVCVDPRAQGGTRTDRSFLVLSRPAQPPEDAPSLDCSPSRTERSEARWLGLSRLLPHSQSDLLAAERRLIRCVASLVLPDPYHYHFPVPLTYSASGLGQTKK